MSEIIMEVAFNRTPKASSLYIKVAPELVEVLSESAPGRRETSSWKTVDGRAVPLAKASSSSALNDFLASAGFSNSSKSLFSGEEINAGILRSDGIESGIEIAVNDLMSEEEMASKIKAFKSLVRQIWCQFVKSVKISGTLTLQES